MQSVREHDFDRGPLYIDFRRYSMDLAATPSSSTQQYEALETQSSIVLPATTTSPVASTPSGMIFDIHTALPKRAASISSVQSADPEILSLLSDARTVLQRASSESTSFSTQIIYTNMGEFLLGIGLGEFHFKLSENGINDIEKLKSCTDDVLFSDKIGMKKIQVSKLRRALNSGIVRDVTPNHKVAQTIAIESEALCSREFGLDLISGSKCTTESIHGILSSPSRPMSKYLNIIVLLFIVALSAGFLTYNKFKPLTFIKSGCLRSSPCLTLYCQPIDYQYLWPHEMPHYFPHHSKECHLALKHRPEQQELKRSQHLKPREIRKEQKQKWLEKKRKKQQKPVEPRRKKQQKRQKPKKKPKQKLRK